MTGKKVLADRPRKREWSAPGALWADGNIPYCEYCTLEIDEVESMNECYYSGTTFCDDCWDDHAAELIGVSDKVELIVDEEE